MHWSLLSHKRFLALFCVFLFSSIWFIHTAQVSSKSGTSQVLNRAIPVQGSSRFQAPVQAHRAGVALPVSITTASWYSLTTGLRPGRGDPIPAAADVHQFPVFDVSFYDLLGNLLSGWLALNAPHAPVIILTHGTPGNRVSMIERAAFLFHHGYNVLLFDFQSYGDSQGIISTLGLVESEDILAAISYLRTLPDTMDSKIGVLGLSMGATAGVLAASKTSDITAMVAESCPVDATRVPGDVPSDAARDADIQLAQVVYGIDLTQARPISVVNKLGHTAIFFINGDQDTETPLAGMFSLYQAARSPKQYWVVPGAGHAQSFVVEPDEYEAHVLAFFDQYLSNAS